MMSDEELRLAIEAAKATATDRVRRLQEAHAVLVEVKESFSAGGTRERRKVATRARIAEEAVADMLAILEPAYLGEGMAVAVEEGMKEEEER